MINDLTSECGRNLNTDKLTFFLLNANINMRGSRIFFQVEDRGISTCMFAGGVVQDLFSVILLYTFYKFEISRGGKGRGPHLNLRMIKVMHALTEIDTINLGTMVHIGSVWKYTSFFIVFTTYSQTNFDEKPNIHSLNLLQTFYKYVFVNNNNFIAIQVMGFPIKIKQIGSSCYKNTTCHLS